MKTFIKKAWLCLALLCLAACNDDFMDRFPETEIGIENFFNSEEDLKMYLHNLYDFPVGYRNADAATDNAATTGNMEIKTMMTGSPSSANINGGWDWGRLRTVNLFLENFRKAQLGDELLNHYEGVARFFRARFYMEKVKRFSDVPWYDKVLGTNDEDQLYKPRDPREMVVQKIFEDYEFAAKHVLPSQPAGAVNKWVVKAFQARHALYEGTYRKYHAELGLQNSANQFLQLARDVSKDIMDNGGFAIHNTGNPQTDYAALFISTNLTANREVILPRMYEFETLNAGWSPSMFGNFEVSPSKDLAQAYLMADGTYYSQQPGFRTKLFVEEFQGRDPRLSQTYAFPGWELVYTSTYSQGGGVYVQQLNKNFSGYHLIKGFLNTTDQAVHNSVDFPVLRYAEVLLNHAEAKAELGELGQADLDRTVNQLRNRAGMPPMSMSPQVDPLQAARYPNIQSAQAQVLLEIRRERRVELAIEGFRFDDLMRWEAGKLLENEPEGLYFPGPGKYDLTGDGIEDIVLIPNSESVPAIRETNSLGTQLVYYRTGFQDEDAGVYLANGVSGTVQTVRDRGVFVAPKYYYRPIPATHVTVNPNLKQIMGWQ